MLIFIVKILIALFLIYMLSVIYAYIFQRRMMYRPDKHVVTPYMNETPEFETVTLKTADGLSIEAFYKEPQRTTDGRLYPTILYMHGNTGPASDAAHKLIPIADEGFGILLQEYRGYGGNQGKPSESGLINDSEAGLHYIHIQQGNEAQVVYWGMSLGTGVANGLVERRAPAAFIQECGFTAMADVAKIHYWYFPVKYLLKDTYLSMKRARSMTAPLLVLHGQRDRTIPYVQGQTYFEAAGSEDKEIKLYPEGRHVNLYDYGASDDVLRWLKRKFKV